MTKFSYDDPDSELVKKIECAVLADDSEGLISLVTESGYSCSKPCLLTKIFMFDAPKCAAALLEGKLGIDADVNLPILGGLNPLHHAARCLAPRIVELFLSHGALLDLRVDDNSEHIGLVPLHIALHEARWLLLSCRPGLTTFELIAALCHPEMGKALDTIKLLAWSTKDVGKEAYHYAVEGKFIELAFLLIVAREKVLVPITFLRKDGTGLSGSTTLRECLRNQIVSLEYEATNLMGEVEFERSTQVPDKIMIMKSTALLLDVFERAGERIEEYLRVRQPNVRRDQVEKDVASRLVQEGFKLDDENFDFGIGYHFWFLISNSVRNPNMVKKPRLDNWSQLLVPHFTMLEKTNLYPPLGKFIYGNPDWELVEKIEDAVLEDDSEGLISVVTESGYSCSKPCLLTTMFTFDASKCAVALLEGKLGIDADVNLPILGGLNPLHHAAQCLAPRIVELFVSHGARTDLRVDDNSEYKGLLPLNIALHEARWLVLSRCHGLTTFKLIAALCQPEMEKALATSKVLAWFSKDVEKEAYHYAMEGKIIELAFLLIVAREKVLVPITFHGKYGTGLSGSTTLRECVRNQIVALEYEETNLMGEVECEQLTQVRDKIVIMKSTALLLDVFERAGERLEEYLRVQQPNVQRDQVEKDVASRLVQAGFNLKDENFDFGTGYNFWVLYFDSVRTPIMVKKPQLDNWSQLLSPHLPMLEKTNMLPPLSKGIHPDGFHRSSVWTPSFDRVRGFSSMARSIDMNLSPKAFSCFQNSASSNVQMEKITKAIERNVPSPLSGETFAYMVRLIKKARFLKKGIRCA